MLQIMRGLVQTLKQRWFIWLLLIGFLWLLQSRQTEIAKLAETLIQGDWPWILAAASIQLLYYLSQAGLYQAAFRTVEVQSRLIDLLPLVFGALFVNVVAPAGGTTGIAIFVNDAARRGQSTARTAAGAVLVMTTNFIGFSLLLAPSMAYLFLHNHLESYHVISAIILALYTIGLSSLLGLGLWRPSLLQRLLGAAQRLANGLAGRIKRPPWLAETWAEQNAAGYTQAAQAIRRYPQRLGLTLAAAVLTHLVNLASLYAVFLAFHTSISAAALVAGYSIGVLLSIVAPTPQGLGVVEGVMALVFTSLGVPGGTATVVALAFRGLNFWIPLLIGFLLLQRLKVAGTKERALTEVWGVRIVAILTALMGIINVISVVAPALAVQLHLVTQYSPLAIEGGGLLATTLSGFALILLAGRLWRRKHTAWLLTLVVLVVSAISHLVKGLDYQEALLALALAGWLFILEPHFHARSDRPSIRQGLAVLLAALVFTTVYGVIGFYLLSRQVEGDFDSVAALKQTIIMFTEFHDPGLQPLTGLSRYLAASVYAVGAITMGYALIMLVQPVLIHHPATAAERRRAQEIVEQFGRSSLARFALLPGKSYYFSEGGSVVAYEVKQRVAVALGDPIGPPADATAAIFGYTTYCAGNDWLPAWYETLPDYLEAYQSAGFENACMGHEGIVELSNGQTKEANSALSGLQQTGYSCHFYQPPLPVTVLRELQVISDEWLTMTHGREAGFSSGGFEGNYVSSSQVMVIASPQGIPEAFANIVPEYARSEVTVDLVRWRPEANPAVRDYLFANLLGWASEQGYATFSLGYRSQPELIHNKRGTLLSANGNSAPPQGPAELPLFRDQFHPRWSPRYLVYPASANPSAVWNSVNQAGGAEGFLSSLFRQLPKRQTKN